RPRGDRPGPGGRSQPVAWRHARPARGEDLALAAAAQPGERTGGQSRAPGRTAGSQPRLAHRLPAQGRPQTVVAISQPRLGVTRLEAVEAPGPAQRAGAAEDLRPAPGALP